MGLACKKLLQFTHCFSDFQLQLSVCYQKIIKAMATIQDERNYDGQNRIRDELKRMNSFSIHSVASELKLARTSMDNAEDNMHNQYQIKGLLDDLDSLGEVINLAYVSGNGQVHINEQLLYLLQRYSSHEIAFIGFVGGSKSGKSVMLDTILNVSYAEGNQFTNKYSALRQKGIYLWTLPYSYNSKLKIFFLQCTGVDFQSPQFQREDQILLDLVFLLCSSLAIFSPLEQKTVKKHIFAKEEAKSPAEQNLIKELIKSSQRITKQDATLTKEDKIWPQNIFYFNRRKNITNSILEIIFNFCNYTDIPSPISKEFSKDEELSHCFSNNLKGLSSYYVKKVADIAKNMIFQTITKEYESLKYTGNICCKLLINSIKYMNKKPRIKINKICASIIKEIYEYSYAYHLQIYNNSLRDYFNSEDPLPFDEIINGFKLSNSYTLESFNETMLNEQLHELYQNKLMRYIQEKELAILQINEKKTKKKLYLIRKDYDFSEVTDLDEIKKMIVEINDVEPQLDHNRCQIMAQRLFRFTKNIQSRIIQEKLRLQQEKKQDIKRSIRYKCKELKEIQEENRVNKSQNDANERQLRVLLKQMGDMDKEIKNNKRQIQGEKKFQKQYLITKQSKKEYAENLLEQIREYQEKKRENLKIIDQINKEYEYYPQILTAQKKIEEKERLIKELEKLQSRLEMSKFSILHGKNSMARSAVQKNKESMIIPTQPVQAAVNGSGRVIKKLTKK